MKVGFSGSRFGMTCVQARSFSDLLERLNPTELHHGDCVGSDDKAMMIARDLGIERIISHPPTNETQRAFVGSDEARPARSYLDRNKDIVDETSALIAAPDTTERLRSGTWSTVRYARTLKRPIYIVMPRGRVETENVA